MGPNQGSDYKICHCEWILVSDTKNALNFSHDSLLPIQELIPLRATLPPPPKDFH